LHEFAARRGWRITTLLKSSCTILDVPVELYQAPFAACEKWRASALRLLLKERPEIVILAQRSQGYLNDRTDLRLWKTALANFAALLRDHHVAVAVIGDTPTFMESVPICVGRALRQGTGIAHCAGPRDHVVRGDVTAKEREALADIGGYVDGADLVCGPRDCPIISNNLLMYRDSHHFSARFSPRLYERIGQALLKSIGSAQIRGEFRLPIKVTSLPGISQRRLGADLEIAVAAPSTV
jgi:hypothetical protein